MLDPYDYNVMFKFMPCDALFTCVLELLIFFTMLWVITNEYDT